MVFEAWYFNLSFDECRILEGIYGWTGVKFPKYIANGSACFVFI